MKKIFHTHNTKGRILWAVATYVFFWFIFYGTILVMPLKWVLYLYNNFPDYMDYYALGFVPFVSLFIPPVLQKRIRLKMWFLYILHIFIMTALVISFLELSVLRVYSSLGA